MKLSVVSCQLPVARRTPTRVLLLAELNNGPLKTSSLLKSLWDDFPRFFAEEMHHLSFAVKTHHAPCDLFCVFHGRGADNFFHLRDVRTVHAEYRQAQPQEE